MESLIFAYGTLNDPAKQEELFGHSIIGVPDILEDYTTIEIIEDGVEYLAAVPAEGVTIKGSVLQISDEALESADAWEGDSYQRKLLTLRSGVTAWVYLKKNVG